jgi:hypothetical protein
MGFPGLTWRQAELMKEEAMPDWKELKLTEAEKELGAERVKQAKQHAADTVARCKPIAHGNLRDGRWVVARGPLFPVADPDGEILPASASPSVYLIFWYGRIDAEYPAEVNEYVLMRGESPNKGFKQRVQVWAVESAEEAAHILKAAFGINVKLPAEEPKS